MQPAGAERQPGHHRVDPVIEQRLAGLVPVQVQGLHVRVRVFAPELAHGRGDDEADRVADGDPAGLGGRPGARGGLGG